MGGEKDTNPDVTIKKNYNGLDVVKIALAVLVAARHMIQVFFSADSRCQFIVASWLSNLAVPMFFVISGFFLFKKTEGDYSGHPEVKSRGRSAVLRYCRRILWLYVLWSILYLPISRIFWIVSQRSLRDGIRIYAQEFLFSSDIAQLWYLPALLTACLLVWFLYSHGMKLWIMLIFTGVLFAMGCIGDNLYFNQKLPSVLRHLLLWYCRYFLTMRNGIFYGSFFVCLGLWFSKTKRTLPFWLSAAGTAVSLGLMALEVRHCGNINMVFSSAPAAFCLFSAASSIRLKDRRLYARLRAMSEWIFLSHFYFFYILVWTAKWNPVPFTGRNIAVMNLGAILLFAWCMARLGETKPFRWLKIFI